MNPAIQQWMDVVQESPKMDLDDEQIKVPQRWAPVVDSKMGMVLTYRRVPKSSS